MFKDEVNEILLPKIEIPKLKGHTKIELTDVHTGKKEVIEHDNAITNGLQSYLRTLGAGRTNILSINTIYTNKLWKQLLGGIYLFDNALPNDAKYMPAGASMIGNSYFNCSNNGNPTELGSYNAVESHADHDNITLVYDWGTAQGNGTISSVCLGTVVGGRIGYGNGTSKTAQSSRINIYEGQSAANTYNYMSGYYYSGAGCYYDNYVYLCEAWYYSAGTSEINVYGNSFPCNKIDLFEAIGEQRFNSSSPIKITFTLPETLDKQYMVYTAGNAYKSSIMLLPNAQVSANTTFNVYLLDIATGNVTKKTITNNTGANIVSQDGLHFVFLDTTYALVKTSDGKVYKINHTNSAVIGAATLNGATVANGDRLMYCNNNITEDLFVIGSSNNYIYDSVKNEFLPTNGILQGNKNAAPYCWAYIKDYDCLGLVQGGTSGYMYTGLINNPLRLMTINNLDTPVEKTASKTMKVTYTITRATE